jgi:hypothetical protein
VKIGESLYDPTIMSAASERSRNNVRAGLFVAVSLAIGAAVFLTLQKLSFEERTKYQIRFTVAAGVAGLSPGSEVRIGGLKRGEVTAIIPKLEGRPDDAILVEIAIASSITLYDNAKVLRVAPLLGNTAWINFVTIGTPSAGTDAGDTAPTKRVAPEGVIAAIDAPGMLTAIVGDAAAEQIVSIIAKTDHFTEVLDKVPADYDSKIVPALDAARDTLVSLRTDYGRWRTKVDETLDYATGAAKNLEEGTAGAKTFVADAQNMLSTNRPKIDTTISNLEAASGSARETIDEIRNTTLPQVSRVLNEGERAIGEFADALDRVDTEIAERMPDIRNFLGDLRSAAQQLKLATIEVRRSPWRLLYKPSTDVLAHEQLYEATRSFVLATGDLKSTVESIDSVLRLKPQFLENDPDLRERLQSALIGSLERYEAAQRQLFGVLTKDP